MNLNHYTSSSDPAELLRALTENAPRDVRNSLEEWYDAAQRDPDTERDEGYEAGRKEADEEAEPYRAAWSDLFAAWEESLAEGCWPGAGPDDSNLLRVMAEDMQRAGEALALLRDIAAGKFVDPAREAAEFFAGEQ